MPHNWVTRDSGARRRSPHFQSRLKLSSIWSAIRAVAGPDRACGWRPYDDSVTDGNTRPGSGSSSHVLQPGIVAGRPPCIPHALVWSPGLLSGVPLGDTRCEASPFSPVTLLIEAHRVLDRSHSLPYAGPR